MSTKQHPATRGRPTLGPPPAAKPPTTINAEHAEPAEHSLIQPESFRGFCEFCVDRRTLRRVSRLLLATTNGNKVREIRQLLAGVALDLLTLDGWPEVAAPEETGRTFAENARAKALYYAAATGELTVAEDSGLSIDALGGRPGVESARYGGADTSYPDKFALIYEELRARAATDSPARFVCALALVDNGRILYETQGIVEGRIAPEPKGDRGFGYDPIFFYPPYQQTLAEAGDRKAAVSHRGEAFRRLRDFLERRLHP
jgi:XTP/dITP diphosphohydrolase